MGKEIVVVTKDGVILKTEIVSMDKLGEEIGVRGLADGDEIVSITVVGNITN